MAYKGVKKRLADFSDYLDMSDSKLPAHELKKIKRHMESVFLVGISEGISLMGDLQLSSKTLSEYQKKIKSEVAYMKSKMDKAMN